MRAPLLRSLEVTSPTGMKVLLAVGLNSFKNARHQGASRISKYVVLPKIIDNEFADSGRHIGWYVN